MSFSFQQGEVDGEVISARERPFHANLAGVCTSVSTQRGEISTFHPALEMHPPALTPAEPKVQGDLAPNK
jgi:hypothetical protein